MEQKYVNITTIYNIYICKNILRQFCRRWCDDDCNQPREQKAFITRDAIITILPFVYSFVHSFERRTMFRKSFLGLRNSSRWRLYAVAASGPYTFWHTRLVIQRRTRPNKIAHRINNINTLLCMHRRISKSVVYYVCFSSL